MLVRALAEPDRAWKDASLRRVWGSTEVARRGALVDASGLPGFVAVIGDQPAGLLTYAVREGEMEIVTLHVDHEGRGAGRALMDAAQTEARRLPRRRARAR